MTRPMSRPVAPRGILSTEEGDRATGPGRATRYDVGAHGLPWARLSALHAEMAGIYGDLAAQDAEIQLADSGQRRDMNGVMQSPGRLITTRDLAERLQVDRKTVQRWRGERRLPDPIEIGGVVRWRQQDIDEWLDSQTPNGATP